MSKSKNNIISGIKQTIFSKKVLLPVVLFVIVTGLAIGWFVVYSSGGLSNNKKDSGIVSDQVVKSAAEAKRVDEQAQTLLDNGGSVPDAVKVYDEAINTATDNALKQSLLFDKSILYFNSGDYSQALKFALEAEKNKQDENIDRYIAEIYVKLGEKKNAIDYYNKAKKYVNEQDKEASYTVDYYNNLISQLKG